MFNLIAVWYIGRILVIAGGILAGVYITRQYRKGAFWFGFGGLTLIVSGLVIDGVFTLGLLEVAGLIPGG